MRMLFVSLFTTAILVVVVTLTAPALEVIYAREQESLSHDSSKDYLEAQSPSQFENAHLGEWSVQFVNVENSLLKGNVDTIAVWILAISLGVAFHNTMYACIVNTTYHTSLHTPLLVRVFL